MVLHLLGLEPDPESGRGRKRGKRGRLLEWRFMIFQRYLGSKGSFRPAADRGKQPLLLRTR